MRETLQGRTAIIISHRASVASHADKVAVLVQGRIAEVGSPHELVDRNGHFAELVRKEMLAEDLAKEKSLSLAGQRPTSPAANLSC